MAYLYVHLYNGILHSNKKNKILQFATTWMDLEGIRLNEISETEKDKYKKTNRWNLKTKQNR